MIDRRVLLWGIFATALLSIPISAPAQQADDSVRLRGVIDNVDGQSLTLKAADGTLTQLLIAKDAIITRNESASLSSIKPGDFIASAAVKGDDGKLHSSEVRIFPAALRGLGEGQRPMQEPGKTMTNASVLEVAAAPEGQVLKVKFAGGSSELIVGPQVPIVAVVIASASDLKPGTNVFVSAVKSADDILTANRILAQ